MATTYQTVRSVIKERRGISLYNWVFDVVADMAPKFLRAIEKSNKKSLEDRQIERIYSNQELLGAVRDHVSEDRLMQYAMEYVAVFGTKDGLLESIGITEILARWEYSKGVYQFHPAFFEELVNTDLDKQMLSIERFLTLPELGVLIEFPRPIALPAIGTVVGEPKAGEVTGGVFSIANHKNGKALAMVLIKEANRTISFSMLTFDRTKTVLENLMADGATEDQVRPFIAILNILLYIADVTGWIGDRDIIPPRFVPAFFKRKGKKQIIDIPREPVVWKFGEVIGPKLERWVEEEKKRTLGGAPSPRGPVRPHYRRAHWRRARCGKGRTEWRLIWVHQSYVNCDIEEGVNLPASIRQVKSYR